MLYKYPIAQPDISEEELRNVTEAVKSGWISSKGKFIEEFEREFAKYVGKKHGIAVSNGTVALHLALLALGIGPGDEVIVPDLTFAATINAVLYIGARPIIVDVHPDYWCINPEEVKKAISPHTKAIILVHLYGHPCDMDALIEMANSYGIYVVEDAAEAHGAEYKGQKVGSFGHITCFSFYANKVITTGEGGMCLTNDTQLAEKMRILRDHGMNPNRRYWHDMVGFNYRMTNLQAALGVAQLKRIEKFIEKRRQIARAYSEELSNVEGITLHPEMPWAKCVFWLYSIQIDEEKTNVTRDLLMKRLELYGIETRPFFYPLHQMPPYSKYQTYTYFTASKISMEGLHLPTSTLLEREDVTYVTDKIKESLKPKL